MERTQAHPKYAKNYRFEADATWVTASPCGEACAGLPQVLALDCEMCMSEVSFFLIVLFFFHRMVLAGVGRDWLLLFLLGRGGGDAVVSWMLGRLGRRWWHWVVSRAWLLSVVFSMLAAAVADGVHPTRDFKTATTTPHHHHHHHLHKLSLARKTEST